MNKYNIKVGDYVEIWNGDIGVIEEVSSNSFVYKLTLVSDLNNYIKDVRYWHPIDTVDSFKIFKRIGTNDFSEKKSKLVPINKIDATWNTKSNVQNELIKYGYIKINELIDHINAIQERLNEDGSKEERH